MVSGIFPPDPFQFDFIWSCQRIKGEQVTTQNKQQTTKQNKQRPSKPTKAKQQETKAEQTATQSEKKQMCVAWEKSAQMRTQHAKIDTSDNVFRSGIRRAKKTQFE